MFLEETGEGYLRQKEEAMYQGGEMRGMWPQTKEAGSHQQVEEQEDPLSEHPEGPGPASTFFKLVPNQPPVAPDQERINFSCFKAPCLPLLN